MRTYATLLVGLGMVTAIVGQAAIGWALDCEQVQRLIDDGKRPADVARELGITTPDVQACLAGVVEMPESGERRPQRMPYNVPGSTDALRHPPNS